MNLDGFIFIFVVSPFRQVLIRSNDALAEQKLPSAPRQNLPGEVTAVLSFIYLGDVYVKNYIGVHSRHEK